MAYLPVPSMQTGGMLWFPDLTAADPFYILPLAVTGTMFFILEVGHHWLNMSILFTKNHQFKHELCGMSSTVIWRHVVLNIITVFFSVGCRVWYRQPQPASHEDRVQGHALYHPPPHHQLPHSQFSSHSFQVYHTFLHLLCLKPRYFYCQTNFRRCLLTGWPPTASPWVKWLCSDTPWSEKN